VEKKLDELKKKKDLRSAGHLFVHIATNGGPQDMVLSKRWGIAPNQ
jgi:hypothetical protein